MQIGSLKREYPFLQGGGEMGELTRNYDWSLTSIGDPGEWPQSLRTTVSNLLHSKFPMFLWWGDEMIQFYNDGYRSSLGNDGKHPSALGQKGKECWPEIWDIISPLHRQVATTGEATWREDHLIPLYRNGKLEDVYWTYSYSSVLDEKSKHAGILATCTETTRTVIAHRVMEESEAKYRSLFESMDQGVCMIEMIFDESHNPLDYRFLEINPVFESQTGLKNAAGRTARELVPDLEQHWFENYGKVALTGESIRFTECSVAMGRMFDVNAFRIGDSGSRKIAILFTEITQRKKAEEALRLSEQNLRNMILQSPVAMCILRGPTFVVEIANRKMYELWGRSEEELLQKSIFEGLPEVKDQGYEELLTGVYRSGERFSALAIPVTLPRKEGLETVYINLLYEAFREGDGTISGVMAVANEVTEEVLARQKIEEIVKQRTLELADANEALIRMNGELKRSNTNLEEFAFAASHDLKEPIRKIHFFSDRLRTSIGEKLTEEEKSFFERMQTAARRMGLLIDDLLAYSQVSVKPKSFTTVDLNQLLPQVLNDLDLEIEQKHARINIAELGSLEGHHRHLQQLFQNIIGNALKYRNPEVPLVINISSRVISGREIPLHLKSEDYRKDYKLIEISDNGIGFDQGDAERIFNVFTRLHGNTEYKGTGVGLSIARKVMDNHNGFITAKGELKKGASFQLYFPAE